MAKMELFSGHPVFSFTWLYNILLWSSWNLCLIIINIISCCAA